MFAPPDTRFSMRRRNDQPTVVWNADISQQSLADLEQRIPIRGARAWLIAEGLRYFLDSVAHSPSAQRIVHDDIQKLLFGEPKPQDLISLNLRIPTPLYNKFNELFPEWGGTTWFMRRFLESIRSELIQRDFFLGPYVERASASLIASRIQSPSL